MRVVIMGGTSGIGRAAAERLAGRGAEVIVTGRDPERLAELKAVVTAAEQVDCADETEVREFLERTGEIDHLVLAFSPGGIAMGPVAEVGADAVRAMFEGKLFAYLTVIRLAQGRVKGSITLLSAASARAANPGTAVLAAVNGAIERIVPPLAAELAPVRVNAVSPGLIDTPWWSFIPEEQRTGAFDQFTGALPVPRAGRAEEVADAIAYLVSAEYVTGTILPVDGGATIS
ncbi:SDR family oxidoreductase [Actinomadura rupiterrae]|uniref:SDR family oxidoreductase n=1 Tax=Actinomadura rupiterrae TaxID=559627 RepID=UPI0020A5D92D|nr:SDR family oxidoreductase [Actinomadura rupiterrae]MCP2340008.1 NAD(P)-dependent dehydrogenase (short-subunit alcohol dehydrogenase family) [Actinomadura rupiterrae]